MNNSIDFQLSGRVESKLQPINLRILQGAFFALAFGYVLAGIELYQDLSLIEWTKNLSFSRNFTIAWKTVSNTTPTEGENVGKNA